MKIAAVLNLFTDKIAHIRLNADMLRMGRESGTILATWTEEEYEKRWGKPFNG